MGAQAEQLKKAFLVSTPIIIVFLLAIGWRLATMQPPPPRVIKVNQNEPVEEAEKQLAQAKLLYEDARKLEGPDAVAKLREAQRLLQDASAKIQTVREKVGDPEPGHEWPFEPLDQKVTMLNVSVRKELIARLDEAPSSPSPSPSPKTPG
jgi:hypothetical protein